MSRVLPAEVDRAARGAPQLQVAIDGGWENAHVVSLPVAPQQVDRLLDAAGATEVAVELLWPGPPIVFVGTLVGRAHGAAVHALLARDGLRPSTTLEILAGGAVGRPDRAELGAVNAWRSIEPLPIPLNADISTIEAALAARPDLARCRRPAALEFTLQSPSRVWWAIEISEQRSGLHHVRAERVAELLRAEDLYSAT